MSLVSIFNVYPVSLPDLLMTCSYLQVMKPVLYTVTDMPVSGTLSYASFICAVPFTSARYLPKPRARKSMPMIKEAPLVTSRIAVRV